MATWYWTDANGNASASDLQNWIDAGGSTKPTLAINYLSFNAFSISIRLHLLISFQMFVIFQIVLTMFGKIPRNFFKCQGREQILQMSSS